MTKPRSYVDSNRHPGNEHQTWFSTQVWLTHLRVPSARLANHASHKPGSRCQRQRDLGGHYQPFAIRCSIHNVSFMQSRVSFRNKMLVLIVYCRNVYICVAVGSNMSDCSDCSYLFKKPSFNTPTISHWHWRYIWWKPSSLYRKAWLS